MLLAPTICLRAGLFLLARSVQIIAALPQSGQNQPKLFLGGPIQRRFRACLIYLVDPAQQGVQSRNEPQNQSVDSAHFQPVLFAISKPSPRSTRYP
ncbi:MAG: hypothetical protein QOG92_1728, partial [Verrucomicrobiota bacterium]|nr:hypothetical protein [Verrucomicrobiota bacterium]